MNSSQDISMDAEQMVSSETEAAVAANNLDIEIDRSHETEVYKPDSPLTDYNEDDPIPALKKSNNGKEPVFPNDREIKKLALREKLAQNGFALRTMLMDEQIPAHYVSPMSTEDEMSVEDMLLEIPEEDLQSVAIVQGRMYMPLPFARKYILPTLRVHKALSAVKDGNLPGGIDTAILYSIFDQSIIDFAGTASDQTTDDSAIRAVMAYATDDTTVKLIPRMKQGNTGLARSAIASLKELEEACQLPKAKELWTKQDGWINERKDEIASAIRQFEDHVKQNNLDQQLLREQTTLLASLVFEQQKHICDLNDRYLRLFEEKKQLVQVDDNKIHNDVDTIIDTMKTLQEALNQRHETVTKILEPIDMSKIMSTMTKLKIALSEISTRNAQLVMQNDQLRLNLSFMPPQMWNQICDARNNKSHYYRDQRTDPHHLVSVRDTNYFFDRVDPKMNSPLIAKMQRYTAVTSVTDLLDEVSETIEYVKTHSGVELDYSQDDGEIPEEEADNTIVVPKGRAGKTAQNITVSDSATKRSHNTIVHTGHVAHPSKSQRITPTVEPPPSNTAPKVSNTFGDMTPQTAQVHKTSAYFTNKDGDDTNVMEGEHPFSPIGRAKMSYDISDTNAEDDEGIIHPTIDYNRNAKGKGKGKAKGKAKAKGKKKWAPKDPQYMVIPPFGAAVAPYQIRMFTILNFSEVNNPYAVRESTPMEISMVPGQRIMLPDDTLVRPRLAPNEEFDAYTQKTYHQALLAIHQMSGSHNNFYVQELGQGCTHYVNLKGQKVGVYAHTNLLYDLLPDEQRASLGDFWKVLRVRPTPATEKAKWNGYGDKAQWASMEYIPNDTYSFYKVKMTLKQMHGYTIKPCRYWNETCCASVQDHTLYSLAEYCPGLPKDANIVEDNQYMGIHPYRMLENFSKYDDVGKRSEPDIEATITALMEYGTIPDMEQTTLEDLMEKVQEVTNKYFLWVKSWPFLAAHRLLTMQLSRCNHIKKVLIELLKNHPLSSVNNASFSSNENSGNPPALAGSSSQSGETMDCFSQSAYRHGYGGRGGRGY